MSENNQENQYSADSIQALEGMEHVRKRPSMYIGDVGVRGLHHLVYEVVDNSIDEALAGHCDVITVTINADQSLMVEDNGRGIPVGIHKKEGVSALEVVMTKIGAGGKFDKDSYKVSGGLHGVGVSCVNALSQHMRATVHRDGEVWEQEYERGKALYDVKKIGTTDKTGTIVTFTPDTTIFVQTIDFNYDTLAGRLRELAYLNKGISVRLIDLRGDEPNEEGELFHSKEGLKELGIKNIILYETIRSSFAHNSAKAPLKNWTWSGSVGASQSDLYTPKAKFTPESGKSYKVIIRIAEGNLQMPECRLLFIGGGSKAFD